MRKSKEKKAADTEHKTPPTSVELNVEARFDRLCLRLGVPLEGCKWSRWAMTGMRLAIEQPEFQSQPARRGRGPGAANRSTDAKILDVIETVMTQHPADFSTVLAKVIKASEKSGWLRVQERTAHPKRLKQAWRRRQKQRGDVPTLASVLRGCWD